MPQRRVFPFVRILCQRITVYKFINPGMLGACPTRNVLLNFAKLLWMDGTRIHSILPSFGSSWYYTYETGYRVDSGIHSSVDRTKMNWTRFCCCCCLLENSISFFPRYLPLSLSIHPTSTWIIQWSTSRCVYADGRSHKHKDSRINIVALGVHNTGISIISPRDKSRKKFQIHF